MTTLEEQVREIAEARAPRKGLDPDAVTERALKYLYAGKCQRAPQAVEWAFHDLWDSENNRAVVTPCVCSGTKLRVITSPDGREVYFGPGPCPECTPENADQT